MKRSNFVFILPLLVFSFSNPATSFDTTSFDISPDILEFNTLVQDQNKTYKQMCLAYVACKNAHNKKVSEQNKIEACKKGKGTVLLSGDSSDFPTSKDQVPLTYDLKEESLLEISSVDDESKGKFSKNTPCEDWTNFQVEKNDDIKTAKGKLNEKVELRDGEVFVIKEYSDALREHIAKKLEQGDFKRETCQSYYDGKGLAWVVANGVLNDKPINRVVDPQQCEQRRDTNSIFSYKRNGIYTSFGQDPLMSIEEFGKNEICRAMATRKISQSSNSYVNSCNDYLDKGSQICASVSEPSDPNSATEFHFDNPRLNFADIKFKNQDTCKKLFYNKFKQCLGLKYNAISYTSKNVMEEGSIPKIASQYQNPSDPFVPTQVGTPASGNQLTDQEKKVKKQITDAFEGGCSSEDPTCSIKGEDRVRENQQGKKVAEQLMIDEIYDQWNVCFAFRELSREVADDFGSWEGLEEVTSFDGRFRCQRNQPYTQDYKACRHLVLAYNSFVAGEQVTNIAGQGWSMVRQNQIQKEQMAQTAPAIGQGEQIDPDKQQHDQVQAGLNAQQKVYKHMQQKEQVNLGFYSAQAGTLTVMLAAYPTPNNFSDKCDTEDGADLDANCIGAQVMMDPDVGEYVTRDLFANQEVKRQMWGEVMQAGAKAALAALKANAFGSRAKDLDKYKEEYQKLNKDHIKKTDSDYLVGYCQIYPTTPMCANKGERQMGNSSFGVNSVGVQGNDGQQYGFNNDEGSFGELEDEQMSDSQKRAIADLSGVMDQDSAASFDNSFDKIGAGGFSRSGAGGGGGGGGAGGGGGGGSAYNPSAGGRGGSGGSKSAFGPARKLSYKAGGTFKSGKGVGSGKKKSANPFSNLFGSKKSRSVASQVNDIAPKHSGLFDKISKRYGTLQKENRLLNLK